MILLSPWIFGLVSLLLPSSSLQKTSLRMSAVDAAKADEGKTEALYDSPIGDNFPRLTYGTAWKKDQTEDLVYQAIHAGFRHVDTACQPKHYHEAGVGKGWTRAAQELGLSRADIWLQTKYTSIDGQDSNQPLPYDPDASKEDQVKQSFATSLQNLQTEYVDSLVMHGPENEWENMWKVWNTMEELVDEGKVKQLGISNLYNADALKHLYENARIKPSVVQNRFYKESGYDVEIRRFCLAHNIEYQTFWTLSSRHFTGHPQIKQLAKDRSVTPETLLYALVIKLGHTPLNGTKNHMKEDLELLRRIRADDEAIVRTEEIPVLLEILGVVDDGDDEEEL